MYDYVLQFAFDKESENKIKKIKDYLKEKNIVDKERNWKPHVTIDLYNCGDEEEFIKKLDSIIKKISKFKVRLKKFNTCNNRTLYIEPFDDENFYKWKKFFDKELNSYMLEKRKTRNYIPHITINTSEELDKSILLAKEKFKPMKIEVKYIWVYNRDMRLIKTYELKNEVNE